MRVKRLKEGRRKVGEAVIEREDVQPLRSVAVGLIERNHWKPAPRKINITDRDPICQDSGIVAYPGDGNTYCYIVYDGTTLPIPDRTFVIKLLQLL